MNSQSVHASIKPAANDFVTGMLKSQEKRGLSGCMMRFFVFLVSGGSTVITGAALVFCFHDVHTRFWLGDLPIVCLAVSLSALLPTSFMLIYRALMSSHRKSAQDTKKLQKRSGTGHSFDDKDWSYRMSLQSLRFVFMLICILSSAAAVLGYFVVMSGVEMSGSLTAECGASGNSQAVEAEHAELVEFQSSNQCDTGSSLDECSGFDKAFPPPAPFASYLKVLEFEQECGGFCSYSKPLFNTDSNSTEACARRLGRYLWSVASCVGVPAMVIGSLLAFLSFLFYSYDGL
eukprot:gb/GFBE01041847.1/.p1 GENE.gb/GFBE01041847.1/~~gb/GFBE01041847.1/.p1  ORF type:complete len:289 (+),score=56.24 gb/GFBE01041847.1/:1-867(+)